MVDVEANGAGAHAEFGAVLQESGADALAVEEGAVGGVHVFKVDEFAANFQQAVMARNFGVVEAEIGAFAANNGAAGVEVKFQALVGASDDGEQEVDALGEGQAIIGRRQSGGDRRRIAFAERGHGGDDHSLIDKMLDLDDGGLAAAGATELHLRVLGEKVVLQEVLLSAVAAAGLHSSKLARGWGLAGWRGRAVAALVTWPDGLGQGWRCATIDDSKPSRRAYVSEHISRKELKQDKVRETFEHGAEAVLSHTRLASIALLVLIVAAAGYIGWKVYSDRQNAQAQVEFDEGFKIFNAQILTPGQPTLPGELTYADPQKRSEDAEVKFAAAANKYPSTKAGKLARYYSALCLMDLDKLNQASEELNKLNAGSDKELAALGEYQRALIAERNGKTDEAVKTLRALSTGNSVLVPKPLVLLELAGLLKQSDPKQAATMYEQLKKDYPNTAVSEEADRGLQAIAPKS